MDHLEMVEKLREKANVSYEEASRALEACDWDLLDALLMLESEGRLNDMEQAAYTTRKEAPEQPAKKVKVRTNGVISQLLHGIAGVIKKCNAVSVQIKKKGEVRLALPLTAVIVLVVFLFWWVLAAAVIAMLCGYRFSIKGLTIDETVNNAMEKAGSFVDNVVKPIDVHVVVNDEENKDGDQQN